MRWKLNGPRNGRRDFFSVAVYRSILHIALQQNTCQDVLAIESYVNSDRASVEYNCLNIRFGRGGYGLRHLHSQKAS